jgi:hypothetical protein
MNRLINWLFPCFHKRTTFPQSNVRGCYVVCVDCGKEFPYSWAEMKVLKSREALKRKEKKVWQHSKSTDLP